MKAILPNAIKCGCSYELFWHLNPRKLEAFFEAYKLKAKEDASLQDSFAWLQGVYIRDAILSCFGKTNYPREPKGLNHDDDYYLDQNQDNDSGSKGKLSDGQNFALFMVKHNKALTKKRTRQT